MFDENIFLFAVNLFILAFCGGLFIIMPRITRKSYLFGVKIPSEQASSPLVAAIKSRYIRICFFGSLIIMFVCIVQFTIWREITLLATIYLPFLILPVFLTAFIPAWKRALSLKKEQGWFTPNIVFAETGSSRARQNLSSLPWVWYALSFVIVVAAFITGIIRYPALPEMIAANMDANFYPTRWVEKTYSSVLMMPLVNAATLVLMIIVAVFIEKAKLQIDPAKPQLSFAQHRVYRRRLGHSIGFLTLTVIFFIAMFWLPVIFPDSPVWGARIFWSGMILIALPIIVITVVMVKTGQGGCKVKIDYDPDDGADYQLSAAATENANTRSDDKYWKWGMFYYNSDDPARIVENRFGTNLGFNYARLPAKIGAAVVLLGLIVLYVWLTIQLV